MRNPANHAPTPRAPASRLAAAVQVVAVLLLLPILHLAGCGTERKGAPAASAKSALAPPLGVARTFAVLGGSTVTNTGPSVITGDLGVSPGSAVTGFPPGLVAGGTIHAADAVALQAQNDTTTVSGALADQACTSDLTGQDLGGLTLVPGVYCFSSTAQLTGALTLDAGGDATAVWLFRAGSTLTTASSSSVLLTNGGQPCNVFWQVGSSATLGTGTSFIGHVIALTSITLTTGASVSGSVLARNGAVTLDSNTVGTSACGATPTVPAAPTLGKAFGPAAIPAGGISTLTITLGNPDGADAGLTGPLVDSLPDGLVLAATPGAVTTCGGALEATAGGSAVTLTGGTIPAGHRGRLGGDPDGRHDPGQGLLHGDGERDRRRRRQLPQLASRRRAADQQRQQRRPGRGDPDGRRPRGRSTHARPAHARQVLRPLHHDRGLDLDSHHHAEQPGQHGRQPHRAARRHLAQRPDGGRREGAGHQERQAAAARRLGVRPQRQQHLRRDVHAGSGRHHGDPDGRHDPRQRLLHRAVRRVRAHRGRLRQHAACRRAADQQRQQRRRGRRDPDGHGPRGPRAHAGQGLQPVEHDRGLDLDSDHHAQQPGRHRRQPHRATRRHLAQRPDGGRREGAGHQERQAAAARRLGIRPQRQQHLRRDVHAGSGRHDGDPDGRLDPRQRLLHRAVRRVRARRGRLRQHAARRRAADQQRQQRRPGRGDPERPVAAKIEGRSITTPGSGVVMPASGRSCELRSRRSRQPERGSQRARVHARSLDAF
ncbi:MAG: DUF3494 domain-containing protein [Deltaproteobacteria bacterium]|nr:DUF3494 domain-containing protein [Deltaproteobacteria bacterium]